MIEKFNLMDRIAVHFNDHTAELQAKHEEELKEAVIDAITSKGAKALEAVYGRKLMVTEKIKVLGEAEQYYKANHEPK